MAASGPSWREAGEVLVEAGRRMRAARLVVAAEGNLSIRLDGGRILTTPSGADKGTLTIEDLVLVDSTGRVLEGGRPSSELAMHRTIYELRPEVRAIAHGHPAYATAFAAAGRPLDAPVLSEIVVTLGPVPLAEYATPGTDELAESVSVVARDHHAFLLKNHGAVAVGRSLEEAVSRLEVVEHFAQIVWLADALGGARSLDPAQIARLERLYGRPTP